MMNNSYDTASDGNDDSFEVFTSTDQEQLTNSPQSSIIAMVIYNLHQSTVVLYYLNHEPHVIIFKWQSNLWFFLKLSHYPTFFFDFDINHWSNIFKTIQNQLIFCAEPNWFQWLWGSALQVATRSPCAPRPRRRGPPRPTRRRSWGSRWPEDTLPLGIVRW